MELIDFVFCFPMPSSPLQSDRLEPGAADTRRGVRLVPQERSQLDMVIYSVVLHLLIVLFCCLLLSPTFLLSYSAVLCCPPPSYCPILLFSVVLHLLIVLFCCLLLSSTFLLSYSAVLLLSPVVHILVLYLTSFVLLPLILFLALTELIFCLSSPSFPCSLLNPFSLSSFLLSFRCLYLLYCFFDFFL